MANILSQVFFTAWFRVVCPGKDKPVFYGWWIIALFFISSAFYGAAVVYGFTAFINPLVDEFGWSYAAVSFIASLRGLEVGLIDFIIGVLLDRFGGRKIAFIGCIVVGTGFLMISRVNSFALFSLFFVITFIGGSGLGSVVIFQVITRWFHKRVGLAIGIALAGYGMGGFAVPLLVYLISFTGWRGTYVILGLSALILGVIMVSFLRSRPEDIGSTPDGLPKEKLQPATADLRNGDTTANITRRDYSLKEVLSNRNFWILTFAGASLTFSLHMVLTHVMPYLEDLGYARSLASIVAMMVPVLSVISRLGVGWASDFRSSKNLLIAMLITQAAGILFFLNASLSILLVPFVILVGIAYGGSLVLRLKILKDYFGRGSIGSITGFYMGATVVFAFFGPLMAGIIFDKMGNYSLAWIINAALLVIGILIMLGLKNPQTQRD